MKIRQDHSENNGPGTIFLTLIRRPSASKVRSCICMRANTDESGIPENILIFFSMLYLFLQTGT